MTMLTFFFLGAYLSQNNGWLSHLLQMKSRTQTHLQWELFKHYLAILLSNIPTELSIIYAINFFFLNYVTSFY